MSKITSIFLFFGLFVAIGLNGQNAKQHYKAGEQFMVNGLVDAAIDEFKWALKLDPNDGKIYEALAAAMLVKEDTLQAAENYERSAAMENEPAINYFKAANLYLALQDETNGLRCIDAGLLAKPKDIDLLLLKAKYYFERKQWAKSYEISAEAIKVKDLALSFYYHGASAYRLGLMDEAQQDLEKAIIRDKNMVDAYLTIAEMQIDLEEYDYAVDNCSMVLLLFDTENIRALVLRSRAFHATKESDDALSDITKAIGLSKNNVDLLMERAQMNFDYALYSDAMNDFSTVLNIQQDNDEALWGRAHAAEKLGKTEDALADFRLLRDGAQTFSFSDDKVAYINDKIYTLGKEENKPSLAIDQPVINDKQEVVVEEDKIAFTLTGEVSDESGLKEILVNNEPVEFSKNDKGTYCFSKDVVTQDLDFLSITVVDIYNNIHSESYPIEYIETVKPVIDLISPIAGGADIIKLETDDNTLYVEGRVLDKSNIASIKIDEVNASFIPGDYNPKFTATIDVQNRKDITITATDIFGNESSRTYDFAVGGELLSDNNPMGKTWVVLIENSDYEEFTSLSGPTNDMDYLSEALQGYQISKILRKKNMTKREMERFFTIDLRDLIISNQVNSLLIWYAGHGDNINDMGFWIPIDGRQGDEYSFYNINALKASLYSYQSLTHIMVVSDACHAGNSFTIAMRGADHSTASCNQLELLTNKSALVLTSSTREAAMDNSLFTKTFANALLNNPKDCIPVDAIADRVTLVMNKNSGQKPMFGKIAGLEDKNGTFFFISKK